MRPSQFLFRIFIWVPFTAIISLYVLVATTSYTVHQASHVLVPLCKLSKWTSSFTVCLFLNDTQHSPAEEMKDPIRRSTVRLLDRLIRDDFIQQSPRYTLASHGIVLKSLRMGGMDSPRMLPSHLQAKWDELNARFSSYQFALESLLANSTLHAMRLSDSAAAVRYVVDGTRTSISNPICLVRSIIPKVVKCSANSKTSVSIYTISKAHTSDVLDYFAKCTSLLQDRITELESIISDLLTGLGEGEMVFREKGVQYRTWWSYLSGNSRKLKFLEDQLETIRWAEVHVQILARDMVIAKDDLVKLGLEAEALRGYFKGYLFGEYLSMDIMFDSLTKKLLDLLDALTAFR